MLARTDYGDVLARVEASREAEWQARQPLLERFRNTPDERKRRVVEGLIPSVTLSDCAEETGRIHELAEALEKLCGEGLRFERWLDTLPASETEDYSKIRRRLP
jgi:hypothetical protein